MIKLEELNKKKFKTTPEEDAELAKLLVAINKIRTAYGKPMTVTTGFRTMEDHIRIYKDIAKKAGKKFDETKVPKGSKHLYGQAVDIADPDGELMKFMKANRALMKTAGVYCEEGTRGWVHFQIVAPKSGNLWFLP